MSSQYYVQINRRAFGPFSTEELQKMVEQGRIDSATLLSSNKQTWKQAGSFPGLFSGVANPGVDKALQPVQIVTSFETSQSAREKPEDERVWFASLDGRESAGPFSTRELFEFFQSGKFSQETRVWRQGDKFSHRLGEIQEIQREFQTFQAAPDPFSDERQAKNKPPKQEIKKNNSFNVSGKVRTTPGRVREKLASKIKTRFLSTWICLGVMAVTSFVAMILQSRGIIILSFTDFTLGSASCLLAGLAFIGSVVFGASFLHAFWSALPQENARATPDEAVAFLFIPGFGIYWIFQALYGGAVDANEALKRDDESETDEKNALTVSPGWALATSVFFDLGGPFNPVSGLFFLLCLGVTTNQMKNAVLKLDSLNVTR